ncbi:MAG: hypothetical protein ICV85_00135, partial [Tolypothrix sp. T3-bin4]|nr:hypothetical protein [Tolypothrix sp. T3-bin4]
MNSMNVLDLVTSLSSTSPNNFKESAILNVKNLTELNDPLDLSANSRSSNYSRTIANADLEMKTGYDYDGRSSLPTIASLSASPTSVTEVNPLAEVGTGIKGEYFAGKAFDVLKLTRTDSTVNFDWGKGSPDASLKADNFSVRWTGQVQPKYSDIYTFYTTSDDGIRLWVDGKQLINNWTNHSATENKGSLSLMAEQKYDIKLEYFEKTGDAVSKLMWSSSNQLKEIISQNQLYSLATPSLDINDKPVIMVPGSQSIASGTTLSISGLQIADLDAGNGELTVTLNATNGTLHVNGNVSGGVTMANIKNNGTGSIILAGTLMQISATLASPTGLIYAANSGFLGSDTIQVSVNDNGNTGSGGPQTDVQSFSVSTYASNVPSKSMIGTNLNGITDWSTEWP